LFRNSQVIILLFLIANNNLPARFKIKSLSGYASKIVKMFADYAGEYTKPVHVESTTLLPFVFIIDEINRGEISKILGELFFALDPGCRGELGEVSTQYSNLHDNPEKKFFITDNVYIIGTMNDIDRSVDSFDFAMRRRFRFIEIKASERLEMLNGLQDKDEAIFRMNSLNEAISDIEELNENYHIGAAYFLKLEMLNFEQLWTDYLAPLLQDYIRGMYDEKGILNKLKDAYNKTGASSENIFEG
jgi:5-methylcytosine-specific restriction endonuclease McrBC GTP-binding regulatory subunit McrB